MIVYKSNIEIRGGIGMDKLDFIYKRKSVRAYTNESVPKEDLLKLLEAATYAPSPKHQQNWHFVVVQDRDRIEKMAEAVRVSHTKIGELAESEKEQKQFMSVLPYYLNFERSACTIIVYGKEYDMIEEKILRANHVSEAVIEELKSPQSGAQAIGAAVENFLLGAANMGYGACYMTGPTHAKREIEEIIGFEKPGYTLMAMISIGVPAEEPVRQPRRLPLEEVVTFID